MRARNIKAEFFKDDQLSELSYEARLLYVGLWCYADREGYFEYRPKRIKAEIFPYDEKINIEKVFTELTKFDHVITFRDMSLHEMTWCYIPKFLVHQKPHPHEAKSIAPKYNQQNQCHDMSCNVTACQADIRNDDIRNDDIRNDDIRKETNEHVSEFFEKTFWPLYPKRNGVKQGKTKALKQMQRLSLKAEDFILMHQALMNYTSGCNGYPKDAERFLKNDFWKDWINFEGVRKHEGASNAF